MSERSFARAAFGAAIFLIALHLFFLIIQFVTGIEHYASEQQHMGQPFQWFGWGGYVTEWLNRVAENDASEVAQIALAAWVSKHLRWRYTKEYGGKVGKDDAELA